MKCILPFGVVAVLVICGPLMAQSTTPATPQNTPSQSPTTQAPMPNASGTRAQTANEPRIAPGSVIPVQLTKTIDAKKAKTGDEVVAKVTQDMKTDSGQVLVPKDTKVIGHVTEAQARHKNEKESQLAIAFNEAVLRDQQVQLPMSIQAVIGQENNSNENASANNGAGGAPMPSAAGPGNSPMGSRSPNSEMGQTEPQPGATSGNGASQPAGSKRPPINAKTEGVIGISNVTLAPASNSQQGSLLTSEKNNVKLESGTMLLLKVSQ